VALSRFPAPVVAAAFQCRSLGAGLGEEDRSRLRL